MCALQSLWPLEQRLALLTGLLITEVVSVIRIDKVCTWGWAGKVFPKKAMLEGTSRNQQEAGGEEGTGAPGRDTQRQTRGVSSSVSLEAGSSVELKSGWVCAGAGNGDKRWAGRGH